MGAQSARFFVHKRGDLYMANLTKDFTRGSIPRQLLWFTLPFMASNALQVLYSTIDMIIVGNYVGTAGLSAVSQSSMIVNFATMVCLGFSNAGQVLIAQAMGAGKKKELNDIIGTLFTLILLIGILFSVVFLTMRSNIMQWINIPSESHAMAIDYLVICAWGLVFTAGYNVVSAILRGMGDSKRPFLFIGIATVVNLVLDIVFTGMLGWGVAGAAYATIIGQAVSFIFSLFYLYRSREAFGFDFRKESFRLNKKYCKMMFGLGTPMAIQAGCINLSMLYVNSLVNSVSVVASAAFGVGTRIDDIFNKISQGLQFAALPMISQNLGAKDNSRAKRVAWWTLLYSGLFACFTIAVYFIFGKDLFMMFSDDSAVHNMAGTFISAIVWIFPALAIMRATNAFIQGIGNATLGMVLSLLDGVILRIGLSWLFGIGIGWGFYGFVLGYGVAAYGCAIPGFIYFISGIWKKRKSLADSI